MSAELNGFSGRYKYLPTGEVFALKIVPKSECRFNISGDKPAPAYRTHLCRGGDKFWDGTPEDFAKLFEKL